VNVTIFRRELCAAVREHEVVGQVLVVVQKELLDQIASISETKYKILVPKMSEILHDVPQDWPVSYDRHRLGNLICVAQAQTETTAKQDYLHPDFLRVTRSPIAGNPETHS
jgi:hypothetical protein